MSLLLCTAAALATAASARADSIKLTNGLTYDPVTIMAVSDGAVRFQMRSGIAISKSMSELAVVGISDDKNFTLAESLFQQGNSAEAEKAYSAARNLAAVSWKKTLIDYRLLAVSESAGQIDKATARWLKIVDDACRESPNRTADVSAGLLALRPRKLAPAHSKANDRAITLLKGKIKEAASDAYVKAFRQLLADLYERQGQLSQARAEVVKLAGKSETPDTKPSNVETTTRQGTPPIVSSDVQLRLASLSLKEGEYERVVRQLQPKMKQFTTADLPSAMLLLGCAKLELSKENRDKSAAEKMLLEAGLDLMRVVVFFGSSDEAPHALLSAGQVNERLGNTEAAKAAYSTLVKRFAQSPVAKEAQKEMERMKKGTRD
ncbi:MAG: hypothetical protein K8R91_00165 [Phycisphaerae bacterium]|nr:hypothetical protein [Phycisphaerae bacterium]